MKENASSFPVAVMCKALKVSASGYYDWLIRKPSRRRLRRDRITRAVRCSFHGSHGIYGHRKVHEDLVQDRKITVCKETVRTIMREEGLRSKVKRTFVVTTDSRHDRPVHDNHLGRDFSASEPNRKWAADITYIRTLEGWLYLAAVMDLYSRRIVGWAFSHSIDAGLVCTALSMALMHRNPGKNLLHHSDRGVQYASQRHQDMLGGYRILCSMSRKGDCWDNACMESFFGKLKGEHVQDRVYRTREEAKQDLFWYIEVFYNRMRRHASLGYVSPVQFEANAVLTRAA
jgi:transposase InsO family protein